MSDDASATYRGYRKQALYALGRILSDKEGGYVYRPEGGEDLAVFDYAQQLVEVVQVKDYSSPLTLSDFKPSSPKGFFARMLQRLKDYPRCRHTIASYGALGPELVGAIDGIGLHRQAVVQKLAAANADIGGADAVALLDALQGRIENPIEELLRTSIVEGLSGTVAIGNVDATLELLLFWMFDAAEHRRDVTRQLLLTQIERIGAYLAALRDDSLEWMTSVVPVRGEDLDISEREQLNAEYRLGVHASWKHILADADCLRPERLAEVHRAIQKHSIVIVRGASGQGKSSLAWRYLREFGTDGLQFHIRLVEGRSHALRVANVLQAHARSLCLSPIVLLDVSPADTGWIELLGPLAESGLKVLVAVREEDFRRAGVPRGELDIGEVALDQLTRDEASQIYERLTTHAEAGTTLDFEDAWARYSAPGGGPLMEFTHIVLAGERLTARIANQILRIQSEVASNQAPITPAHLRLLALCALAHAADCRVDAQRLFKSVQLDPLSRPLAPFQNEYFLRLDDFEGQTCVAPLHPVRSRAMLSALLQDCPEIWRDLAIEALPLVVDADIEAFLLAAFSRCSDHAGAVEAALHSIPLRSWTHAAGVTRALLWEGVNRYERENHEELAKTIQRHGSAWWIACDLLLEDVGPSTRNLFAGLDVPALPPVDLTSKRRVFEPFEGWAHAAAPPGPPSGAADWIGAGDTAFWLGFTGVQVPLRFALVELLPTRLPDDLGAREIGAFVSGQYALGDKAFLTWHETQYFELTRRFLSETKSVHLGDDGESIKVFFPIEFNESSKDLDESSPHAQARSRLDLARRLYPQRSKFGTQGLGIEVMGDFVDYDATSMDVSVENLFDSRIVQMNALFMGLVNYRHRRNDSWVDYVHAVTRFRQLTCECLRKLHQTWEQMLSEREVRPKTRAIFPAFELMKLTSLGELSMLPRAAVDEWGGESEGRTEGSQGGGSRLGRRNNLPRLRCWDKAWRKYESAVGQISSRAQSTTLRHITIKRSASSPTSDDKDGQLLLINLEEGWKDLQTMQREFRMLFRRLCEPAHLEEIENCETGVLRDLWLVAFAFVREPLHRRRDATRFLTNAMSDRRRRFLETLVEEVSRVLATNGRVTTQSDNCRMCGSACLLVVCDHDTLKSIEPTRRHVVEAIWRAAQSQRWSNYEATPLLIEWPLVVIVHQVVGRAVMPAGTQISTLALFSDSHGFQVEPHHLIDLPIVPDEFAAAGLRVWDLPLLRAAVAWQTALVRFVLSGLRGNIIAEFAEDKQVPGEWLNAFEESFEGELTSAHALLRRAHEDLCGVLQTVAAGSGADTGKLQSWLTALGDWCGLHANDECSVEVAITPSYVMHHMHEPSQMNALAFEIIDWAISVATSNRQGVSS